MKFRAAYIAKNILCDRLSIRIRSFGLVLLVVLLAIWVEAQSSAPATPVDDLPVLIQAASAARESGDPSKVASANARVLALALGKLANVRLAQSAFPQALEL